MATKRWIIDAGNSTNGPVGFVLRGIEAPSAEAALALVRRSYVLPEAIVEYETEDEDGNRASLNVYINADALTLDNVREDDEEGA